MSIEHAAEDPETFDRSREKFQAVLGWLAGQEAGGSSHADLEARLQVDARELFRLLLQDHLDLRAGRETRLHEVLDAQGGPRPNAEAGHTRGLDTVFGEVQVSRIAYRRRGQPNLHPADGLLNLPTEKHSHGLRRLAAIESTRGSFDDAVQAIERATGHQLGKRQVETLAARAAVDVETFYARGKAPTSEPGDVLVISCDGKGVVMRPDALRPATATAAAGATPKLATRLSKGEKRNRKRIAEVGTVYDATPAVRTPTDILPATDEQRRDATAVRRSVATGARPWRTPRGVPQLLHQPSRPGPVPCRRPRPPFPAHRNDECERPGERPPGSDRRHSFMERAVLRLLTG